MTRAEAARRLPVLLAELDLVRTLLGTYDPRRKMSSAEAADARRRIARGEPMTGVARLYGIDRRTLRYLVMGLTYREDNAQP